jgi:hypothetical protein
MSDEEIFATVKRIYPELMELIRQKEPELEQLYTMRFRYAMDDRYPPLMRLHNAYEIMRTYLALKSSKSG